ncbi:MAG: CPBP family intramembrane glutamic endopeptidase [Bacillota bacterium]
MAEETITNNEISKQKPTIWLDIIKFQLLWYLFNFLILFLEQNVAFDLPLLDNFYLISFKIVGRSLFLAFFLYWATMVYSLSFKNLGLTIKNFFSNLKLGVIVSCPLLLGSILCHFYLKDLNTLININNLEDLMISLLYFIIIFVFCLIPALSKEVFFRGFIFTQLKKKHGYLIAFILELSFYALVHLNFKTEIIIIHLIVAFISTYLYHKTDSLLSSIIFQATYQASLTTFLFSFLGWPF